MNFITSDKPCITYSTHCATRDSPNCTFCGENTSGFSKEDWNQTCDGALNQNIQISHNYRVEHIQGMAVREQDYVQVIYYRCANCGDTYVERDDQR